MVVATGWREDVSGGVRRSHGEGRDVAAGGGTRRQQQQDRRGRLPNRSACCLTAPAAPQDGTDTGYSWLQVQRSPSQGCCLLRPMRSCCGVGSATKVG